MYYGLLPEIKHYYYYYYIRIEQSIADQFILDLSKDNAVSKKTKLKILKYKNEKFKLTIYN